MHFLFSSLVSEINAQLVRDVYAEDIESRYHLCIVCAE